MKKLSWKGMALLLGILVGGLVFVSPVSAFDADSLASQTTVGMYDDIDPYDLSLDAALLYQIERWRLYTTASAYNNDSYMRSGDKTLNGSGEFLLGTSGQLGPGAIALFYQTSTDEDTYSNNATRMKQWESWGIPDADGNPYDGLPDTVENKNTYNSGTWDDWERSEYHAGYGMDFGIFSLGLGFNYETEEWSDDSDSDSDRDDLDSYGNWANGETKTTTYYHPTDRSAMRVESRTQAYLEEKDEDADEMSIVLGSNIRVSDKFKMRAYVSYIEEEYTGKGYESSSDVNSVEVIGDWGYGGYGGSPDGYFAQTSKISSGTYKEKGDLDGFGIGLIPYYYLNDKVMFRLDLGYRDLSGDISSRGSYTWEKERSMKEDAASSLRTVDLKEGSESWSGSGDVDETAFMIGPKVYFTYGPAQFSFGATYRKWEEDGDWAKTSGTETETRYSYDDTGAITGWTVFVDEVGDDEESGSWNDESERWSFPVSTIVKLSERWTFRAGAEYHRVEWTYKETERWTDDNVYGSRTEYDADGNVTDFDVDGNYYVNDDGDEVPYPSYIETSNRTEKDSETYDYTTYRLGLGYQMTENVNLDLMFVGNAGDVSTDSVFASITFAF